MPLDHPGEHSPLAAVIFDFDGVILESAKIKTNAFLELFGEYSQHREQILKYHLENVGVSRFRKFEWIYRELLRRPISEEEGKLLGERFSRIVLEKILNCPFVPGAVKLLDTLESHCPLFVASGTPQEELDHIIKARGIAHYFIETWGTPKTKVEIIDSILRRFNLDPRFVLFVGDGISDYRAARAMGIPFLARKTDESNIDWAISDVITVPDLTVDLPLDRLLFADPLETSRKAPH